MPSLFAPSLRTAAVVSTGTEILQGLYPDSNAWYLSQQLTSIGVRVVAILTGPDDETILHQILEHAQKLADIVIITGGLGPTEDDVNRFVLARLWNVTLKKDALAVAMMRQRFEVRGQGEMPESNEVQALVPDMSEVFYNEWGTAPGFYIPPTTVYPALMALPGPPKEMQPMFEQNGLPLLRRFVAGKVFLRTRTLHTYGSSESSVNDRCRDLFHADPHVGMTILAKPYGVDLRISASADSEVQVDALLQSFEQNIRQRVDASEIYGVDDETMQSAVAALLVKNGITIAAAESCTGGLIAKLLTDIPGSSAYLRQSHIVYADEAKISVVGVQPQTLEQFGAVSEQVATELADGVRRLAGSSIGIGVTGIAGPSGGTLDKPVGLTYIALSDAAGSLVRKYQFPGDRELNRVSAAQSAFLLLRNRLLTLSAS
ncbi:MAG: competence/damage-inducible protein A [Candidatus Sumerlaeaceae bacterium]